MLAHIYFYCSQTDIACGCLATRCDKFWSVSKKLIQTLKTQSHVFSGRAGQQIAPHPCISKIAIPSVSYYFRNNLALSIGWSKRCLFAAVLGVRLRRLTPAAHECFAVLLLDMLVRQVRALPFIALALAEGAQRCHCPSWPEPVFYELLTPSLNDRHPTSSRTPPWFALPNELHPIQRQLYYVRARMPRTRRSSGALASTYSWPQFICRGDSARGVMATIVTLSATLD